MWDPACIPSIWRRRGMGRRSFITECINLCGGVVVVVVRRRYYYYVYMVWWCVFRINNNKKILLFLLLRSFLSPV